MIQRLIAAALTAALLSTTGNGTPSAPATTIIHLHPVGASRTWGTATIAYSAAKRQTTATLTMRQLVAGVHLAQFRAGRCGHPGALRYALTALHGPRTWMRSSTFAFKLRTAGLSLNVYGKGSRRTFYSAVACGNAP